MSKKLTWLPSFLDVLSSRLLLVVLGLVFAVDTFTLDPFPFIDEIVLGISTLLLARWQQRQRGEDPAKPPAKNVTPD